VAKPVARKAPPRRAASAAKKVAKGRPMAATKNHTKKAEPIAEETVAAAPPTAET
jgi:hypothetical protein